MLTAYRAPLLLRIASGWLLVTGAGHTWGYYTGYVTRENLSESRLAAYELMKDPIDGGVLNASFWTVFQMLALQLTLFLALVCILSVRLSLFSDYRAHLELSRVCTMVFAFGAYAFVFVHPQIHAAIIAIGATTLFALAWRQAHTELLQQSSIQSEEM